MHILLPKLFLQAAIHTTVLGLVPMRPEYTLSLVERKTDLRKAMIPFSDTQFTVEVAAKGKAPAVARSLQDLRGFVSISSPADALQFVRLRTSPAMRNTLNSGLGSTCELVTPDSVSPAFMFGQNALISGFLKDGLGLVTAKQAIPIASKYPLVKKVRDAFVVDRLVVVFDQFIRGKQFLLEESVWPDGRYRLDSLKPILKGPIADLEYKLDIAM